MKRLRHPITSIREPFGKAGLIVACLALVFAMAGGAFAAKGALTGKQKKEVAKIAQKEAKKYAGKPGAPGATGPTGAAGKDGSNGANGSNGDAGSNGKSVSVSGIVEGEEACEERGGAMVAQEGGAGTEICNGERGREGSPWTAGGHLPSGKTETGTFAYLAAPEATFTRQSVSFPIELSAAMPTPEECDQTGHAACPFHYVSAEEANEEGGKTPPAACQGSAEEPSAAKGTLCVYEGSGFGLSLTETVSATTPGGETGVGRAGAILTFPFETEGSGALRGSWAVTAP